MLAVYKDYGRRMLAVYKDYDRRMLAMYNVKKILNCLPNNLDIDKPEEEAFKNTA